MWEKNHGDRNGGHLGNHGDRGNQGDRNGGHLIGYGGLISVTVVQ